MPLAAPKPKAVEDAKDDFTSRTGRRQLAPVRGPRVIRGNEENANTIKIFAFGEIGTGKTFLAVGLLLSGLSVLLVSTDIGGSGANSIKLRLKQLGREDLISNLTEIILPTDEVIQNFLLDPTQYISDIYDIPLDVLFWDGFGAWQTVELQEKVGAMPIERSGGKELQPAVESGLFLEQGQWGMVKNATVRAVDKFCSMHNKVTGKIWHKIVTCPEAIKSKGQDMGGGFKETSEPLLQGAGGVLSLHAFDLVMRCKKVAGETERFIYQFRGLGKKTKVRGFVLPNEMDADMQALWKMLTEQLNVVKDAVDVNEINEV
jgi:hypothetical protein